MTAPLPPDHDANRDELVSAYLDGAAAPDEIATVEADPALLARAEELRSVTRALATESLGATARPDSAQRELHISAALGEFDRQLVDRAVDHDVPAAVVQRSASERQEHPGSVTSLALERERRRPRRLVLIAAAAAAMMLLAGIVGFGLNRGPSTDVATDTGDTAVSAVTDAAGDLVDSAAIAEGSSDDADDAVRVDAIDEEPAEQQESFLLDTPIEGAESSAMSTDDAMADDAMADDAMADDAMADDAMDDEAMDDDATSTGGAGTDTTNRADTRPDANPDASPDALPESDDGADDGAASEALATDAEADLVTGGVPGADDGLYLGSFDTIDALDLALRELIGAQSPLTFAGDRPGNSTGDAGCNEHLAGQGLIDPQAMTLIGRALLADAPVEVHATSDETMLIVDIDCAVITTLG